MRLTGLTLQRFRNYEALDLLFADDIVLLYGKNAQGKTNILEAIFLMTCARSHRTGRDTDLVLKGEDAYRIAIDFADDEGRRENLELIYDQEKRRRSVLLNQVPLPRIADLMGLFHAVIFAPEDLAIVKGGPSERRRYLDLLISQIRPRYFRELSEFMQILAQRNTLLKQQREKVRRDEKDRLQLEIWDTQLARAGAYVIKTRQEYALRVAEAAGRALSELTGQKESLDLRYRTNACRLDDEDQLAARYARKLAGAHAEDVLRGATQFGPHRDDLDLLIDQQDVRPYASQGQQRSITLALKIAMLNILHRDTGEAPILLLDDVMSELDQERRTRLLEAIQGYQVFVTCTDLYQIFAPQTADRMLAGELSEEAFCQHCAEAFGGSGSIGFYEVKKGRVRQKKLSAS